MATDNLHGMTDEELQNVAARAAALLQERREQQRQQVIEQARELLASVGLTFKDAQKAGPGRGKRPAGRPKSKKGDRFVNPANSAQAWTAGNGRKPKWLMELESRGEAPKPVA